MDIHRDWGESILIRDGRIIDGGSVDYIGDIYILDGRIARIGRDINVDADTVIDASGLIVSPGFIDMHSHDDLIFFRDRLNKPKILQGVTTVVAGNCGISPAPIRDGNIKYVVEHLGILGRDIEIDWRSYDEYLTRLESLGGIGTNFIGLVGHGTLRLTVMGPDDRTPTPGEMELMKNLLRESLEAGAYGLSTGLIYPPGIYSDTSELIELARIVSNYNGVYFSHIRGEGDTVFDALSEAIRIGREASVSIQVSHLKISSRPQWGRSGELLRMISDARMDGVDISADAYPYNAGSTYLAALLPRWVHRAGEEHLKRVLASRVYRERLRDELGLSGFKPRELRDWRRVILSYSEAYRGWIGKSIHDICIETGREPHEVVLDILARDGYRASMIIRLMSWRDVDRINSDPGIMVGTDGLDTGEGNPHPRAYGTFPRIIYRYVKRRANLTIVDAVRKMSGLPSDKLGLVDRGYLREGYWADIVILDLRAIRDRATYRYPRRRPTGIKYVLVNGVIEVEDGELTGRVGGTVLRRGLKPPND